MGNEMTLMDIDDPKSLDLYFTAEKVANSENEMADFLCLFIIKFLPM